MIKSPLPPPAQGQDRVVTFDLTANQLRRIEWVDLIRTSNNLAITTD